MNSRQRRKLRRLKSNYRYDFINSLGNGINLPAEVNFKIVMRKDG